VLTDVCMPGLDGVTLLQRVRERYPTMPVVLITGRGDVPLAVNAMKAGATDFLEKPVGDAELIGAVDAALGRLFRCRAEAGAVELARSRLALLTLREREVLEHLVSGASNKEAAARLAVSPRTVEFHRAHIMEKTGAKGLPDLVRLWLAAQASEAPAQPAT
jgi:FixJ family two-component response regulator